MRRTLIALGLAVLAVVIQTVSAGVVPWLGLMLASTFCLYGFLRKTIDVGPTQGFLIEVAIPQICISPVAQFELPALFCDGHIDAGRRQSAQVFLTELRIYDVESLLAEVDYRQAGGFRRFAVGRSGGATGVLI